MTLKPLLKFNFDLKIILVGVLYYFSAQLGYFLAFNDHVALPIWPPSGVAFALIILLRRRCWPGITIGALITNIMAYWNQPALPPQATIAISSLVAIGNTLESIGGNFLLKHWVEDRFPFKKARNAFRFLFVTLLMAVISAGTGVLSLLFNGVVKTDASLQVFFSWWASNVAGILLFTPLILASARKHTVILTTEKIVEIAIFIVGTVGICFLLQVDHLNATMEQALPFLVLPFLLWLAFRFDLAVAVSGVVISSLVSVYFTTQGIGPFVLAGSGNSMLLLQIFISVASISTIILSATVKERITAQRELLKFNENLECMVRERTRALNEEINIRKEAEEKIQRTNQELSKRNTELDNFVYSVSHDLRAPIASVLGLINLAKKDHDVAMKDVYLDMINKSAVQQDHFINEILDQSRNSRLDVKREEIYFEPLIDETFDKLKFATTTGKTVQSIITVRQNKPFFCDRWRLKVILNNIISNSIRYRNGRDPVIKVYVEVNDRTAFVEIDDNGKGIAKEHLPNVCKMFYRATDDGAGSGLGLYVVKEAIDRLNGSLFIESEVGRGTTVKLEIPEIQPPASLN